MEGTASPKSSSVAPSLGVLPESSDNRKTISHLRPPVVDTDPWAEKIRSVEKTFFHEVESLQSLAPDDSAQERASLAKRVSAIRSQAFSIMSHYNQRILDLEDNDRVKRKRSIPMALHLKTKIQSTVEALKVFEDQLSSNSKKKANIPVADIVAQAKTTAEAITALFIQFKADLNEITQPLPPRKAVIAPQLSSSIPELPKQEARIGMPESSCFSRPLPTAPVGLGIQSDILKEFLADFDSVTSSETRAAVIDRAHHYLDVQIQTFGQLEYLLAVASAKCVLLGNCISEQVSGCITALNQLRQVRDELQTAISDSEFMAALQVADKAIPKIKGFNQQLPESVWQLLTQALPAQASLAHYLQNLLCRYYLQGDGKPLSEKPLDVFKMLSQRVEGDKNDTDGFLLEYQPLLEDFFFRPLQMKALIEQIQVLGEMQALGRAVIECNQSEIALLRNTQAVLAGVSGDISIPEMTGSKEALDCLTRDYTSETEDNLSQLAGQFADAFEQYHKAVKQAKVYQASIQNYARIRKDLEAHIIEITWAIPDMSQIDVKESKKAELAQALSQLRARVSGITLDPVSQKPRCLGDMSLAIDTTTEQVTRMMQQGQLDSIQASAVLRPLFALQQSIDTRDYPVEAAPAAEVAIDAPEGFVTLTAELERKLSPKWLFGKAPRLQALEHAKALSDVFQHCSNTPQQAAKLLADYANSLKAQETEHADYKALGEELGHYADYVYSQAYLQPGK